MSSFLYAIIPEMRILFIIGSLHTGGAEKQMLLLVQELNNRGVHCEVFALTAEGPLGKNYAALGVPVHSGKYISGPGVFWFIRQLCKTYFQLARVLITKKFDIVHCYLPLANFIGAVARPFFPRRRLIISKRALGTHQDRFKLWRYFDGISNRLASIITVNSAGVRHDVLERENANPEKLRLIYNGLELNPFADAKKNRNSARKLLGLEQDDITIVMVANLIPYKGHEDAIRAIAIAKQSHPNIRLLCAGEDRGIQTHLESLAHKLDAAENVIFLGRRDDVPDLLAASDIGLVASHEEGFCNALLEQMAAGLPVIATDVGGNREALNDGEFGYLVDPHSSSQIASAIENIINGLEGAIETGRRASQYIRDNFSTEKMVGSYLDLYRNLWRK